MARPGGGATGGTARAAACGVPGLGVARGQVPSWHRGVIERLRRLPIKEHMKSFSCGSVVPGCTATFTADTEESIVEQVARHARQDHGLTEVSHELVTQVRANIAA
jgi:predicted small metal-binding protein